MKLHMAVFMSLAFSIPQATAQGVQYNVELPKRQGNLKHIFHYPPSIQITREDPFISDVRDRDPDNSLSIVISPLGSSPKSRTMIAVPGIPAGQPEEFGTATPRSIIRPALSKSAFQTNISPHSHPLLPLASGQSCRVLTQREQASPQPVVAPKSQAARASGFSAGQSSRKSVTTSALQYDDHPLLAPLGVYGGDHRVVKQSVSGTLKPKRGDLLR